METEDCEICRARPARYVCQNCNRKVCEQCFDSDTWLCRECYEKNVLEASEPRDNIAFSFQPTFVKTFILGFLLILIGTLILFVATMVYGLPTGFGLIVFIGPIPLILGAGQYSVLAIIFAVILTILAIAFYIILRRNI